MNKIPLIRQQVLSELNQELKYCYTGIHKGFYLRLCFAKIAHIRRYVFGFEYKYLMDRNEASKMARSNVEWINVQLTDDQMDIDIPAWYNKFGGFVPIMSKIVETNHSLKIGFNTDSASFMCIIVPPYQNHKNSGKMISSFSDDLEECIAFSAYKHLEHFQGGEWEGNSDKSRRG